MAAPQCCNQCRIICCWLHTNCACKLLLILAGGAVSIPQRFNLSVDAVHTYDSSWLLFIAGGSIQCRGVTLTWSGCLDSCQIEWRAVGETAVCRIKVIIVLNFLFTFILKIAFNLIAFITLTSNYLLALLLSTPLFLLMRRTHRNDLRVLLPHWLTMHFLLYVHRMST